MLSGYADVHVRRQIVNGLRRHGMDVVTAQERGQCRLDDETLLAVANSEGRLMLTNDKDFLRIDAEWRKAGQSHAGIVFWRARLRIGDVIRRTIQYASVTSPQDAANTLKFL
jgi:predicted nuclease of predicted toxin-antitoxin system